MADRSSARLFGEIFELLAESPTDDHKEIAGKIFAKAGDYDFCEYQMGADDACLKLGLAQKFDDPDDGETIVWPGDFGFDESR